MDKIYIKVNGDQYTLVGSDVSPETSLYEYLHYQLQLFGTKALCHEGGCGACVVAVSNVHPVTKEKQIFSVNSCLVHVLSCHTWEVTTVEGLRGADGAIGAGGGGTVPHPLQARLAAFNGTQCGYCTPGWVMNMFSIYEASGHKVTSSEVESSFGGNICRCTGYRPIMDAFKSFAVDADLSLKKRVLPDMEDLSCSGVCTARSGGWCVLEADACDKTASPPAPLCLTGRANQRWYKAYKLKDIFEILTREGTDDYMLVAGNTAKGVYYREAARVQIDVSDVAELRASVRDANLQLGAGCTLNEMMSACRRWQAASAEFRYLLQFAQHLDLVAHVPVRNIGTVAGNLALKHAHPEFSSDVFLLLDVVQATITTVDSSLTRQSLSPAAFLAADLKGKVIHSITLPPLSSTKCLLRTYKVMPRAQNAHAIVNAGFLFQLDDAGKVSSATLCFGNITSGEGRCPNTEQTLLNSQLFDDVTLQRALTSLANELKPKDDPREASVACRKWLAIGLFYKAILSLCPSVIPRYASGGTRMRPGPSSGTQRFDTDKSLWPLNQPVPKLEALSQCMGTARYSCDVEASPREVYLAFVLSTRCGVDIEHIDASDALKLPGVVAVLTAADIPGLNSFTPTNFEWIEHDEEILVSKRVLYVGQPVALVAATSWRQAVSATYRVKVRYEEKQYTPVLTIRDALKAPDKDQRVHKSTSVEATSRGDDVQHVVSGSLNMGGQAHFFIEPQACRAAPDSSGGLSLRSSTQWMDLAQVAVAKMLRLSVNKVHVEVERVGGAYGGKASRASMPACAAALAAYKLNRPAVVTMPLQAMMQAVGKRGEFEADYEAGVNAKGEIQYFTVTFYSDCGCSWNDSPAEGIKEVMMLLYASERFKIDGYDVITDKPGNTWCRAPGTTEATALLEHLMDQIAATTGQDPISVRLANLAAKHVDVPAIVAGFVKDIELKQRREDIEKFNSENAWRKRALSVTLMAYPMGYQTNFYATVSIYHGDGTVAVAHGGVEMGQGINTKVAQVVAYTLKIPLDNVTVRGVEMGQGINTKVAQVVAYTLKIPLDNVTVRGESIVCHITLIVTSTVVHGVEMGQGINTKVAQVVAYTLKIPLDNVTVRGSDSFTSPNAMPSNGSVTSESVAFSAMQACSELLERLKEVKDDHTTTWQELVKKAHEEGINLQASHMQSKRDSLQDYDIYGACASEVELDVLTGEHVVTRVDLLEDTGVSLSPEVDVGQVEGAFVMGLGLWTHEQLRSASSGRLLSDRSWNYKPPTTMDIPRDFRVAFRARAPNQAGVLRSKATGEPALTLAVSVPLALRRAVAEARREVGHRDDSWLRIRNPMTVETILEAISPNTDYYKLK